MIDAQPVKVMMVFRLPPGCREPWLELWTHIQRIAETTPDCRRFRLLCNQRSEGECVVLSEWNRAADFHTFVRDVGLVWISRCAPRLCQPAYSVFSEVGDGNDLVALSPDRELALAVN